MTRLLFLFSPVIFSGFCLLIGETLSWLKQKKEESGFTKMRVLTNSRRK